MVSFFESQDTILAGYTLDGTPLESYTHICFQAPVWCLLKVRLTLVGKSSQLLTRLGSLAVPSSTASGYPGL